MRAHRLECKRRHGIDFPELTALAVPRVGLLYCVRADLDPHSIAIALRNIVVAMPDVTPHELSQALSWAFPHCVSSLRDPILSDDLSSVLRAGPRGIR